MIMIIMELEYLGFHLGSQMKQVKVCSFEHLLSSNYRKNSQSSDMGKTLIWNQSELSSLNSYFIYCVIPGKLTFLNINFPFYKKLY